MPEPEKIIYTSRTWDEVQKDLQASTPLSKVEFLPLAIRKNTDGTFSAVAVPYVDARFVQDRLDEVVGVFNWQSKCEVVGGLLMVSIGIRPPGRDEFLWRTDTGQDEPISDTDDDEGIGGGRGIYSRGFKRCGYQWGIARDIYGMPRRRVACEARAFQRQGKEVFSFVRWIHPPNSRGMAEPDRSRSQGQIAPRSAAPAPAPKEPPEQDRPVESATDYYTRAREVGITTAVAAEFSLKFVTESAEGERTDWQSAWDALRRAEGK